MNEKINKKPLTVSLRYLDEKITTMLTLRQHVELKVGKPMRMTDVVDYVISDFIERNLPTQG